jgi:acetolactate synthase I/II/III large subunit
MQGVFCAKVAQRVPVCPRSSMPRVADTVASVLREAGVSLAFGMPGGEVVTAIDGLQAAGIRFVLARNETAAAMMAAGAATVAQVPGLLVTTLGPGLANAINGIADAAQERVPLVVISGIVERSVRGRYTHQIVDHAAMLRPLVKASFEIEAEGAASIVRRALAIAMAEPRGPVHLDLSPAVAAMPDPVGPADAVLPLSPALGIDAASAGIAALRDKIASAERPLILAGFEAARGRGGAVITGIADRCGIPVLTTYKGKGVLDEHHPAALGAAGLSPVADRILLDLVAQADLVLLAGYDPIEMRAGWLDPFPHREAVVEIGMLPADHGMHAAGLRLAGSVADVLEAAFAGTSPRACWRRGEPEAARAALRAAFRTPAPWGPHAVFEELQAALPAGATVTIDSGAHRILLSQVLKVSRPFGVLQSAGWCTMGSAVPLALGAKLAEPHRPAIAVLGDGGLEMTLGELGTLRDQGTPVVVLVLQDESLGLIELKQRQAGLARAAVGIGATRFADIARAFGGLGFEVSDTGSLSRALAEALAADVFSVIACRIGVDAYVGRF